MRMCWLLMFAGLLTSSTTFAGLIKYQENTVGTTVFGDTIYRYTFTVSGFNLQANQELDIRFDPGQIKSLSNPTGGGSNFNVLVLQPNTPTGSTGVFSALALVNNPVMSLFTVDATLFGDRDPGSQAFYINQYNSSNQFVSVLQSGFTVAAVPEPSTFGLGGMMLVLGSAWRARRRRFENSK